ncbi:glycosyltransferase family 2 protein [Bacillus coahuilensis]|uniref:glycosyltransferase family 2 protein n=1 Tax=Bacillus coahuilensis TaxID=408580 RepID=UPI001ED93ACE|nr:glycosyltransferase [Bacillus coahuilensis]
MQGVPKFDISVIIPMYNAETWIKQCLESVLCQKNVSFEIIIVNDGSTDTSPSIADDYAEKFSQIQVIHKKNGGVSSARNAGLENSHGNYVFFLDIDDAISNNALQSLLEFAEEQSADVSECKYMFSQKERTNYEGVAEVFYGENKINYFHKGKVGYCAGKLIRRALIEDNNLRFDENMSYGEDRNFFYECCRLRMFVV